MKRYFIHALAFSILACTTSSVLARGTESIVDGDDAPTETQIKEGKYTEKAKQLYKQAVQEVKQGNYDEAVDMLEEADLLMPNTPEILNMLAYSQRNNGDLRYAIQNYWEALRLKEKYPDAREYLGEAYLQGMLEQVRILKSYGPQGEKALHELLVAIHEAADEVGLQSPLTHEELRKNRGW